MIDYFASAILVFALLSPRFFEEKEKAGRFLKRLFVLSVFSICAFLFYFSFRQYSVWSGNDLSKYLLPPYRGIGYFAFYALSRFFASYLISFAAAILFLFSSRFLNKKFQERFFEPEEPYSGALAVFLTGWPGVFFYFAGLASIYFFVHILIALYYKFFFSIDSGEVPARLHLRVNSLAGRRISLRWWWLPAAIFVIMTRKWLELLPLWDLLKL